MRTLTGLCVLWLLAGCGGKSAADYERDARAALAGGDPPAAIRTVEEALHQPAVANDPAAAWRLEQVRLDALATTGKGTDVKAILDRLATTHPQQVNASLYRSLADRVKAAGDVPGAIEILTAGDQRYPADHASFAQAIDALKGSGSLPPDQIQKLKALGYL